MDLSTFEIFSVCLGKKGDGHFSSKFDMTLLLNKAEFLERPTPSPSKQKSSLCLCFHVILSCRRSDNDTVPHLKKTHVIQ